MAYSSMTMFSGFTRRGVVSSVFLWALLGLELVKAQGALVGLPPCVATCADGAASNADCKGLDLVCICNSSSFFPAAQSCMSRNCTQQDESDGLATFQKACNAIASSESPSSPSSGPSSSPSSSPSSPSSRSSNSQGGSASVSSSGGETTPTGSASSSQGNSPSPSPTPTSPASNTANTLPAAVTPTSLVVTQAPASSNSLPTLNPSSRSTSVVTVVEPLPPATPTGSFNGGVQLRWGGFEFSGVGLAVMTAMFWVLVI